MCAEERDGGRRESKRRKSHWVEKCSQASFRVTRCKYEQKMRIVIVLWREQLPLAAFQVGKSQWQQQQQQHQLPDCICILILMQKRSAARQQWQITINSITPRAI